MARTLVYTISTGRSGTTFLAEFLRRNLPDAEVHHERTGWQHLGRVTPEASHLKEFNSIGCSERIEAFWEEKLRRDAASRAPVFIETSHFNARGGMMECLHLRPAGTRVIVVAQTRDVFQTVWSYHNRCDFRNNGFTWLFALDPAYRNVIVSSKQLRKFGMAGSAFWYVIEMEARMAYYRWFLASHRDVHFLQHDLSELSGEGNAGDTLLRTITSAPVERVLWPDPQNAARQVMFGPEVREKIAKMIRQVHFDPDALAKRYIDSGRRLGTPLWATRVTTGRERDAALPS